MGRKFAQACIDLPQRKAVSLSPSGVPFQKDEAEVGKVVKEEKEKEKEEVKEDAPEKSPLCLCESASFNTTILLPVV
eukprot:1544196-Amphidinium_carterae.1